MGTSNARAAKRREQKKLKKELEFIWNRTDYMKLCEDNDLVGLTKAQRDQLDKGEYADESLQKRYSRLRYYISEVLWRESRLLQLSSSSSETKPLDNQVSDSHPPVVGDAVGHEG